MRERTTDTNKDDSSSTSSFLAWLALRNDGGAEGITPRFLFPPRSSQGESVPASTSLLLSSTSSSSRMCLPSMEEQHRPYLCLKSTTTRRPRTCRMRHCKKNKNDLLEIIDQALQLLTDSSDEDLLWVEQKEDQDDDHSATTCNKDRYR